MPRSSSLLALAAGALLAVPVAAAADPVPPATTGSAYVDDVRVLPRLGLEMRDDNAPRVVAVPKIAGIVAADAPGGSASEPYTLTQLPRGRVVLLGKNGWLFRGRDVAHLGSPEFRDDLGGRFGIRFGPFTSDGGMVGTTIMATPVGLDPELEERWSTPFSPGTIPPLSFPWALAPGDVAHVVGGGSPSVVNAVTGAVIAPITGLPAGEVVSWVVGAPDGSSRVLTVAADAGPPFLSRRATLHRIGSDGAVTWSRVVAEGAGGFGIAVPRGTAGADGATHLSAAATNGVSQFDGRVITVGPDGAVRWETPVGDLPSRPVVDRAGNVWTATSGGRIFAITPAGRLAFSRRLADAGAGSTVAAYGDGVLATVGPVTARFVARPAGAAPRADVRLAPSVVLSARPDHCVAPPTGRPKTCLYRIDRTLPLRIDAPADGTAAITVALAGTGPSRRAARRDRRTFRVLAGVNMVHLTGLSSLLAGACRSGGPCSVPAGTYRVTVALRTGGPARTFTRTTRVLPSTGRWVDP